MAAVWAFCPKGVGDDQGVPTGGMSGVCSSYHFDPWPYLLILSTEPLSDFVSRLTAVGRIHGISSFPHLFHLIALSRPLSILQKSVDRFLSLSVVLFPHLLAV